MPTWEKVAIGVGIALAVTAAVALVCVAAPVIAEAVIGTAFRIGLAVAKNALIGAAVAGVTDLGIQMFKNGGDISKTDWNEVEISASAGAFSGALATLPFGVGVQVVGNAAFGGIQAAVQGQSAGSIIENAIFSGIAAEIGGAGYIPSKGYWLWDPKHLTSATEAAKRGFYASIGTSIGGSVLDKAKKMFEGEKKLLC